LSRRRERRRQGALAQKARRRQDDLNNCLRAISCSQAENSPSNQNADKKHPEHPGANTSDKQNLF
jgi:hypothetical protein